MLITMYTLKKNTPTQIRPRETSSSQGSNVRLIKYFILFAFSTGQYEIRLATIRQADFSRIHCPSIEFPVLSTWGTCSMTYSELPPAGYDSTMESKVCGRCAAVINLACFLCALHPLLRFRLPSNGGSRRNRTHTACPTSSHLPHHESPMTHLNEQGCPVRKHNASIDKVLLPGEENAGQHALVEEAVPHPLRDDDINGLHLDVHLLYLALRS